MNSTSLSRLSRFALPILLLSVGCASTHMVSQPNTTLTGRSFRRILVVANFQSLEHRRLAEERLSSELASATACTGVLSSQVFFPGQDYTPDQMKESIDRLGIDAVLTLQPIGSGTSSTYVPPTTTTQTSAYVTGNTISGTSTSQTSGGYNLSKPWANFEAVLRTAADGQVAWYATAESGGNAYAGWNNLIKSAAGKTVKCLVSDGVLERRQPK